MVFILDFGFLSAEKQPTVRKNLISRITDFYFGHQGVIIFEIPSANFIFQNIPTWYYQGTKLSTQNSEF